VGWPPEAPFGKTKETYRHGSTFPRQRHSQCCGGCPARRPAAVFCFIRFVPEKSRQKPFDVPTAQKIYPSPKLAQSFRVKLVLPEKICRGFGKVLRSRSISKPGSRRFRSADRMAESVKDGRPRVARSSCSIFCNVYCARLPCACQCRCRHSDSSTSNSGHQHILRVTAGRCPFPFLPFCS